MLTKTVKVIKIPRYKHINGVNINVLVTTWKFLGIPIFISKVINP